MLRVYSLFILTCALLFLARSSLLALEWLPAEAPAQTNVRAEAAIQRIPFSKTRPDQPQLQLLEHEHPSHVYLWSDDRALHLEILVEDNGFEPRDDKKWLWRGS